jgi:hypothetical protein
MVKCSQEKVVKLLDKIVGDETDTLEELFIADRMRSYASKRYKNALTLAQKVMDTKALSHGIERAKEEGIKQNVTLVATNKYIMSCNINTPAMRLNENELRHVLKKRGLDGAAIDQIIDDSKSMSEPAKNFIVAQR